MSDEQAKVSAAETDGSLEDNNNKPTVGVNNVQLNPERRKAMAGTIDAPWGEKPPEDPQQHGTGPVEEYLDNRPRMLRRLLSSVDQASATDRATVNSIFDTPESERRKPHSVLLQKQAHTETTLTERVIELTGRR